MMNTKQLNITPEFIISMAKRRVWFILLPLFFSLIGGIYYVRVTPRIYESKTLILVEGQRVPQSFVKSIVTEDTSERINTISQQILSRTNLEKIVRNFSLFTGPGFENMYMEDKVNILRSNIDVNVIADRRRQTEAFELKFKGKDPGKVMRVLNGLASSFIDENLKVRESQAMGTSQFLESELGQMRERLEYLEEKIKNYRKVNMGQLPEQLETNLRILERLQENLSLRQQNLRESKIRLAELKRESVAKKPSVVVIGDGKVAHETGATIEELISELETLESRYTDKHPDVIRVKKQIADMESKAAASSTPGSSRPSIRISPEFRAQIVDVQREIHVAEIEIKDLEAQIRSYERRIEDTPKREQELLSLKRDYQNIQLSYDSLLNRKLEADIALNMERKQKGEQFRIVDPARLPKRPVEPNLLNIFLMVIVLGLGAGAGIAFLMEHLDSSYREPDDLEKNLNLQVIVSIPKIENRRQMILRRLNAFGAIAFALINICLLGAFGMISLGERF
jgi:polysaccharide chain length determinant protein (PEP-CTERM system associated)